MWAYAVGGKNVIKSWFNYRKANPGGKKTSPLDRLHVDSWPTEWTAEFIDLLTVLTRLTELENTQAKLLQRVVAGPTASITDLAAKGTRWPDTRADRRPRHLGRFGGDAALDLEGVNGS